MKKLLIITSFIVAALNANAQLGSLLKAKGTKMPVIKSTPSQQETDQVQADNLYKGSQYTSALGLYKRLLKNDSTNFHNLKQAGLCCFYEPDNATEAVKYFDMASAMQPKDSTIANSMGIIYKNKAAMHQFNNHRDAVSKDSLNEISRSYLKNAIAYGSNTAKIQLDEVNKLPRYQDIYTVEKDKEKENAAFANSPQGKLKAYQDTINNPCLAIAPYRAQYKAFVTPQHSPRNGADPNPPVYTWYHSIYSKTFTPGKIHYMLFLYIDAHDPLVSKKGVTILLKDGHKISKPFADIDCGRNDRGNQYVVSVTLNLSDADLALLKASPAISFTLYNKQQDINESDTVYKTFLCLLDKN